MDRQRRWHESFHEIGHGVVGATLLGVPVRCGVLESGAFSIFPKGQDAFRFAVVSLAGPLAEREFAAYPPPDGEPQPEPPSKQRAADGTPKAIIVPPAPKDEMVAWRWCQSGHPDDPFAWVRRWHLLETTAWQIVADHRALLLSLAQRIFIENIIEVTPAMVQIKKSNAAGDGQEAHNGDGG